MKRSQLDLTELFSLLRDDLELDVIEIRIGEHVYRRVGEPAVRLRVSPADVIEVVARRFYLTPAEIISPSRVTRTAWPRAVCMYLMRETLQMSSSECARAVGRRDHTTALSGWKRVENAIKTYPDDRQVVQQLIEELEQLQEDAAA